jgi:hypothetical protein
MAWLWRLVIGLLREAHVRSQICAQSGTWTSTSVVSCWCNSTRAGYTLIHLSPTRCNHRPVEQEQTQKHAHSIHMCAFLKATVTQIIQVTLAARVPWPVWQHSHLTISQLQTSLVKELAGCITIQSSNLIIASQPYVSTQFILNNSELSPNTKPSFRSWKLIKQFRALIRQMFIPVFTKA